MGHDVSTIGIHKLDISSIESLANDLSKRFKSHVVYGYYHHFHIDIDGNEIEPTYEKVVFGKIIYPNSTLTLWLSDEFYQIHQILDKYGDNYIDLPYLIKSDSLKYEFEHAKHGVSYEIRDNDNGDDYGTIYNNTFHNFYHHFGPRWWGFCHAFMDLEHIFPEHLRHVNEYRKGIMELFLTIGGDMVFHLDDQGKSQHLTYGYYNWQDIATEISTEFKESTLNISEFVSQNKLIPQDEYPLAFFDDFNDLLLSNK